jgi:hypothetical protein
LKIFAPRQISQMRIGECASRKAISHRQWHDAIDNDFLPASPDLSER